MGMQLTMNSSIENNIVLRNARKEEKKTKINVDTIAERISICFSLFEAFTVISHGKFNQN